MSDEVPAPGKPRINKSARDREQARGGPRPSRAAIRLSSVPGDHRAHSSAAAGPAAWSVTAVTNGRVLHLPSLDPTIKRPVTSTVVRDVKTQPINQGGWGGVEMPAKRPHGRLWFVAQTPDRHAFFKGGKRGERGRCCLPGPPDNGKSGLKTLRQNKQAGPYGQAACSVSP